MDDLISRQSAIDMFQNLAYDDWNQGVSTTWANAFAESADMIQGLPSAQQWIPCSERPPEKNCRCLTTNTAWGAFEVDWNVWINGEWLYQNEKPIAWMPFPEPYKGEES